MPVEKIVFSKKYTSDTLKSEFLEYINSVTHFPEKYVNKVKQLLLSNKIRFEPINLPYPKIVIYLGRRDQYIIPIHVFKFYDRKFSRDTAFEFVLFSLFPASMYKLAFMLGAQTFIKKYKFEDMLLCFYDKFWEYDMYTRFNMSKFVSLDSSLVPKKLSRLTFEIMVNLIMGEYSHNISTNIYTTTSEYLSTARISTITIQDLYAQLSQMIPIYLGKEIGIDRQVLEVYKKFIIKYFVSRFKEFDVTKGSNKPVRNIIIESGAFSCFDVSYPLSRKIKAGYGGYSQDVEFFPSLVPYVIIEPIVLIMESIMSNIVYKNDQRFLSTLTLFR